MKWYLAFYLAMMKLAIVGQFQYRVAVCVAMLGMVAEAAVYLVIWTWIARANGGSVSGYTAGSFAAYYIVWTLVRNMNFAFRDWEPRIREGQFSHALLRPMHPIHYDVAYYAGWKFVMIVFWLPFAAALIALFHPVMMITPLRGCVFAVAIWGAYLVRTMMFWPLGLLTFWTGRSSALFDVYVALEMVLSGRLVPLALLPGWAQQLTAFLPFQWNFSFPIEVLAGRLSTRALLSGLGMQVLWIAIGASIVALCWPACVRRYAAVGA
jgi:ABC-2 type transport system permease protein